jgi:hypothetical protein
MNAQNTGTRTGEDELSATVQLGNPPPVTIPRVRRPGIDDVADPDGAETGTLPIEAAATATYRWELEEKQPRPPCARSTITQTTASNGMISVSIGAGTSSSAEIGASIAMGGPGVEIGASFRIDRSVNSSRQEITKRTIKANAEFGGQSYIVVGLWTAGQSIPREVIVPVPSPGMPGRAGDLFEAIRRAERELRSLPRRMLSLKRVAGFGVYRCVPESGDHILPQTDVQSKRILSDMFREYNSGAVDRNERWMRWIEKEFNSNSKEPEEGKYTLRLEMNWSAPKIVFWTISPIALSMAIALWYSYKPRGPGADDVAVVQTAWTIASYIITAAACEYSSSKPHYRRFKGYVDANGRQ